MKIRRIREKYPSPQENNRKTSTNMDHSCSYNVAVFSDVILSLVYATGIMQIFVSKAIINTSAYFKTTLERWDANPVITLESKQYPSISVNVEYEDLDAFQFVLRLLYNPKIPLDTDISVLLKSYDIADMLLIPRTLSDEIILRVENIVETWEECRPEYTDVCKFVSLHPDIRDLRLTVSHKITSFYGEDPNLDPICIKFLFQDLPRVISAPELMDLVLNMDAKFLFDLIKLDDLIVHSENCVAYLAAAYFQHNALTEFLFDPFFEALRVWHVSPLYLHYVLPAFPTWVDDEDFEPDSLILGDLKIMASLKANKVDLFDWTGHASWIAPPRTGTLSSAICTSWTFAEDQIQALLGDEEIESKSVYVNGVFVKFVAFVERRAKGACALSIQMAFDRAAGYFKMKDEVYDSWVAFMTFTVDGLRRNMSVFLAHRVGHDVFKGVAEETIEGLIAALRDSEGRITVEISDIYVG